MKICGIRGAITADENTEKAIEDATITLFSELVKNNNIQLSDVAYIQFSATNDLNKAYPAKFIRTKMGITDIPMVCYQEMFVEGALERCIRILIVLSTINNNFKAQHLYLKGAKILRPDIA